MALHVSKPVCVCGVKREAETPWRWPAEEDN